MKSNYDFSKAAKNPYLERIIVSVKIENVRDASKSVICEAVVDTNASLMVLPASWKARLGELESTRIVKSRMPGEKKTELEVSGPVRIQIDGFRPIFSEVSFVEAKADYEEQTPQIGHLVLAQSQARIDVPRNRLIPTKHMDLK
jgi:hypothetical protein